VADMWVHEGFTNYAETIFTNHHYGKDAGNAYVQGTRKLVQNDLPIIGKYGVNEEGSGDMYYKGGNLVHLIRQLFDDDEKFRMSLREMNKRFYHATTTSAAVEQFWSEQLKRDLSPLFDQYLRATNIPTLEIEKNGNKIKYRWSDCNSNFNIPLRVMVDGKTVWIEPTTAWKTFKGNTTINSFEPDKNFFVGFTVLQ